MTTLAQPRSCLPPRNEVKSFSTASGHLVGSVVRRTDVPGVRDVTVVQGTQGSARHRCTKPHAKESPCPANALHRDTGEAELKLITSGNTCPDSRTPAGLLNVLGPDGPHSGGAAEIF